MSCVCGSRLEGHLGFQKCVGWGLGALAVYKCKSSQQCDVSCLAKEVSTPCCVRRLVDSRSQEMVVLSHPLWSTHPCCLVSHSQLHVFERPNAKGCPEANDKESKEGAPLTFSAHNGCFPVSRGEKVCSESIAQIISRIWEENFCSYQGRTFALGDSKSLIVKSIQMESLGIL